jgi:phenylacetate-coenzyme A ligase PaaK-like adenylate-forming protein
VTVLAVPGSTSQPSPSVSVRRHLPGYLLLAGTQRLRRSRSLKILREIERAPFAPPEDVRASQFRRLSALLAHAEARVPYYRELFRSLGVRSTDIRTLEDFARLPILTKHIIRERWRDLIRDDVPLEGLSPHFSGGSTGVPLRFYRERAYMDASDAGTFRNFQQCGWRLGEMIAFFWGSNERLQRMSRAEFELRQRARRMYQFDPFHSGRAEMEQWLRRWPSLGARIAYGYASTLGRFAEFIESSGRSVPPLRGVFTTAEKLYPAQRAVIRRVFGCPVFDLYGSSEVQNIAAECPHGRMHVNADFVVLETDRSSARPGAPTPLLATSLWNAAMPFIRYRNEDCADLLNEPCDCGNHFPLMTLNVARVSDNFVFPDGRVVHGEFFTHLMYGSDGIVNFQFHQTAADKITLWIVPGPAADGAREKATASAVAQIKALTPLPVHVEVRETNAIPLSNAGKHRFTRSDVQ